MTESPLVFDGAMGTMLYERGVFLNRCFDELVLSDAGLVESIHAEYVNAGVDVIETNTFGANRIRLAEHGLADRVKEIAVSAARLARRVAGDDLYVIGSVGPCLHTGQMLSHAHREEARAAFAELTAALAEGGVDAIILETFSHLEELILAAEAAKETGLPVFALFTVGSEGETCYGQPIEEMVSALNACEAVDAIGMNCGTGPSHLYVAVERAIRLTDKPFIVMPNAGQPKDVDGRMLYLATPEYFAEYARRFVELGAHGVGGCCGTTPAHLKMVARTVHALSGVKKHIEIRVIKAEASPVEPVPMAAKSRLGSKLASGHRVTSIEILPPRSADLSSMLKKVRTCYLAGIDAINIPDGPRASARISPLVAAMTIQQRTGIEPILHYCCRDRNLIGMQSDLLGGFVAGISNFLIVTGDPPKIGDYPNVTGVFDVDAIGLTQMAHNLNHGRDMGDRLIDPPTAILIGVGANPSAIDPRRELDRFRRKIDAGAEYAITQPVFDPEALLRFLDATHQFPRAIPIVAGIWPLTSFKNAEFMNNEVPGVEVPDAILERMRTCASKEDGIRMGIEIARESCAAIENAVAGFQVSAPFGRVQIALDVLA